MLVLLTCDEERFPSFHLRGPACCGCSVDECNEACGVTHRGQVGWIFRLAFWIDAIQ